MAKEISTKYVDTKVTCSCGNTFTVKSTKESMHIEVCDKCHPAYTGKQNRTSKKGRVEMFNRKYGLTEEKEEK